MPSSRELPDLIRSNISSVWALELLLLLRSADRALEAQEISDELRATVSLATACATQLERVGLVAREGEKFRYMPASQLLAEFVDSLALEYRERPVAIVNLIAAPPDRLQELADAFRFKAGKTS